MCEIRAEFDYIPGGGINANDPRGNHALIMADIEKHMDAGRTLGFVDFNLETDHREPEQGIAKKWVRYTLIIGKPDAEKV